MTRLHRRKLARDLYLPALQELVDEGERVDVRGRQTLEILNYISEVEEPEHHCILIPSRRWNPWLALSESLWILAGRNDVAALKPYNSNISNFSDDGDVLYGAYGKRVYDQIEPLIERLRKDTSDRRAVLSIWDTKDLTVASKDPPCNDMLFFKLRRNRLDMTVMCRSNDIHWGLFAVNLPTFSILQVYLAARLGVQVGIQTHLSNSFHVYTDEPAAVAITDRMLYGPEGAIPAYPEHQLVFRAREFFNRNITHEDIAEMCSEVLEGHYRPGNVSPWPTFLHFAADFLKQYREREWHPEHISWFGMHPDWILAGQLFVDRVWKHESSRV